MKNWMLILVGCGLVLAGIRYSLASAGPDFPDPASGYCTNQVCYDDQTPKNPLAVALGSNPLGVRPTRLERLNLSDGHDGVQFSGTLQIPRQQLDRGYAACLAIDITRKINGSNQLIASRSDFFIPVDGVASYSLSISIPDCRDAMQISLIGIVLDHQGVPVGSEAVIAVGRLDR